jgi:NCAIR mutase (PurE)-related protein
MNDYVKNLIDGLKSGAVSEEEAEVMIRKAPFVDMGFAKVDMHRAVRQGTPEVIYGAGKTPEQIRSIVDAMVTRGQEHILITRIDEERAAALEDLPDFKYYPQGKIGVMGGMPEPDGLGTVLIVTAGTSDIPVAEEAAVTAEALGNRVERAYDCGVAGLHRTLSHMDQIMKASVIIAIAGMEGALASVIGGLSDCPVIAVPTSVGYGASFEGLTALLAMMNSCASGVTVVNIDNGFGAAYSASMINHMKAK